MAEHDFCDGREIDAELPRVLQHRFGPVPGIEQEAVSIGLDQSGEPPLPHAFVGQHSREDRDVDGVHPMGAGGGPDRRLGRGRGAGDPDREDESYRGAGPGLSPPEEGRKVASRGSSRRRLSSRRAKYATTTRFRTSAARREGLTLRVSSNTATGTNVSVAMTVRYSAHRFRSHRPTPSVANRAA